MNILGMIKQLEIGIRCINTISLEGSMDIEIRLIELIEVVVAST